ncbi:hypothetical protein KAR91_13095 [Candidatus Pacearchaeota archaeon]|nr:hypothetical protein [Candidatus Pacearchaeota archaeon]
MEVNKHCRLFLRDVYHYDIKSCHYVVIKRLGYDMSNIDENDKKKRNIQIGMMMRENPKLIQVIRGITESTISDYMVRNKVKEEEIILRQYDGVILTRRLYETKLSIPLDFRTCFESMIISIDRKTYIAWTGQKVIIKGIPYRYPQIEKMYERLVKLNFASKTAIFRHLQIIKDEILNSDDPFLYAITTGENKYNIFLKRFGEVEVSKSMVYVMDPDDIDRERYFDFYIRPFSESLVIEFQ